jgi:hypothetical protein
MDETTSELTKRTDDASSEPGRLKQKLFVVGICVCTALFLAGIVKQNWLTIYDRWHEYQRERKTLREHLPGQPTREDLAAFIHTKQDISEIHERFGRPTACQRLPDGGTEETYLFACPRGYWRLENVVTGFEVRLEGSKVVEWRPLIMWGSSY